VEPTAVIFGDREGCPRDPDRLRKRVWRPALAAAGLRHVTLYSLRHFFASMLIQPGESLKYVNAQLGAHVDSNSGLLTWARDKADIP
jgi:integrase